MEEEYKTVNWPSPKGSIEYRERWFLMNYLASREMNATQAYLDAGLGSRCKNRKSAKVSACRILARPRVQRLLWDVFRLRREGYWSLEGFFGPEPAEQSNEEA